MENILKALDEFLGTREYYIKNLEDEVAHYRKTISELHDKLSATEHRLFNTEQALKQYQEEEINRFHKDEETRKGDDF